MIEPTTPLGHVMTPQPETIEPSATAERARDLMLRNVIRHLPVVEEGRLVGLVSQRDVALLDRLSPQAAATVTVGELMKQPVYTVDPTTPLGVAAAHMASERLGSVVIQQGDRVEGIFTTVDACHVLAQCTPADLRLHTVMTRMPQTIGRERTLAEAEARMRRHHIRHLPVLANGDVVGVLSARDLQTAMRFGTHELHLVEVGSAMSGELLIAGPSASVRRVAERMATRRCGAAVIVDHGAVVGLFTTVDVLRAIGLPDSPPAPAPHGSVPPTPAVRS